MLAAIFLIIFTTVVGVSAVVGPRDGGPGLEDAACGGSLSTVPHNDITQLIAYWSRCTFPTQKLKLACVLSSCPSLTDLCPLTSNLSDALSSAVSALNTCLGQKGLICGINMTRLPMVQLGWTTAQLVPPDVVNGTIWAIPGTGYFNDLSGARFSLVNATTETTGRLSFLLRAIDVTNTASHNCTFHVGPASFLSPVIGPVDVPDMTATLRLNLSVTVAIDLSGQDLPNIRILEDNSKMALELSNFGADFPADIVATFNQVMNGFVRVSVIPSTVANFLSTYAALAFRAAQLNCPPS